MCWTRCAAGGDASSPQHQRRAARPTPLDRMSGSWLRNCSLSRALGEVGMTRATVLLSLVMGLGLGAGIARAAEQQAGMARPTQQGAGTTRAPDQLDFARTGWFVGG